MGQQTYDIVVMRTASREVLTNADGASAKEFAKAAAAIEKAAKKQRGRAIVFASIRNDKRPKQTAEHLAELVGVDSKTVLDWGYWDSLSLFGRRVVEACSQGQLLVLVCHQKIVDMARWAAYQKDFESETPPLTPLVFRLTVTPRLFRKPIYQLARTS